MSLHSLSYNNFTFQVLVPTTVDIQSLSAVIFKSFKSICWISSSPEAKRSMSQKAPCWIFTSAPHSAEIMFPSFNQRSHKYRTRETTFTLITHEENAGAKVRFTAPSSLSTFFCMIFHSCHTLHRKINKGDCRSWAKETSSSSTLQSITGNHSLFRCYSKSHSEMKYL